MAAAIETSGLSRRFGDVRAVEGLDLRVERGEVYAFIGRNGAGKTTTIGMLLGMIRPTAGGIRLLGAEVARGRGPWRRVGYLVDPRILAYATAGLGIASWSAEAGVSGPGGSMSIEMDGTETDFVFGLGVEGKINETMTARIEYFGFGDFDVDIVRVGLNFKLGR